MRWRAAGSAFDRVLDACAWLACALLLFQVASVTFDVVLRYFFGISIGLITALNEWSLVYVAFLGAAWLEREGGHTSDDSILELLGPGAKKFSARASWALGIFVCAVLVWYGAKVTSMALPSVDTMMREVPVFWIYLVIPFGCLLWLVQLLRRRSR